MVPGDRVEVESTLLTLETDKATMDIPSSAAGEISKVLVKVGDRVSENDLIMQIEQAATAESEAREVPLTKPATVVSGSPSS